MQSITDFRSTLRDPARIIAELLYENADACVKINDYRAFQILAIIKIQNPVGCWNEAIRKGLFEIVKLLHGNQTKKCIKISIKYAAARGYFELISHEKGDVHAMPAPHYISANGHPDIINFLHKKPTYRYKICTARCAAENSHFRVIEFVDGRRSRDEVGRLHYAIFSEHFEIAIYLCEKYPKLASGVNLFKSIFKRIFCNSAL